METPRLRIGILGCARIAERALIKPWHDGADLDVCAVASRRIEAAASFAAKHGIKRSYGDYESVLSSSEIDAIYIPLPNALHRDWTIRALNAGLHVLCEKPLASNSVLAQEAVSAASRTRRHLVEGFHWKHHPLAQRIVDIIASGRIGEVRNVRSWFLIPRHLFAPDNIRFSFALGGGSVMDNGCYCINFIRLFGGEPSVVSARAILVGEQVDGAMTASFHLPGGAKASMESSMLHGGDLDNGAQIVGSRGTLTVTNPFLPSLGAVIRVISDKGDFEEASTSVSSFLFQANSFAHAIKSNPTPDIASHDPVANMKVVDEVYRAAGLALRP